MDRSPFNGLLPGDYTLFAWRISKAIPFNDPLYLAGVCDRNCQVTLSSDGSKVGFSASRYSAGSDAFAMPLSLAKLENASCAEHFCAPVKLDDPETVSNVFTVVCVCDCSETQLITQRYHPRFPAPAKNQKKSAVCRGRHSPHTFEG
jgi:hypothetical protein